jgi:Uma2 family endonuclease
MSSHEFRKASEIPFAQDGQPGEALRFAYLKGELTVMVEAPTREDARFIGTDIGKALDLGLPAAQTRILQHVNTAEAMGQPLACALTY